MTEVERLTKEVAAVEARRTQFENKLTAAQARQADIRAKRNSLLAEIAEGSTSASKTLHSLDTETNGSLQNVEAFTMVVSTADTQLAKLRDDLRRAERAESIDALDVQIVALVPASNKLEDALSAVRQQSAELFAATKAVAMQLHAIDDQLFDGGFEYKLTAKIKESIWNRIEEFNVQNPGEPRPTFYDRVKVTLTGAVANLRYLNLEGNIVAGRGEKLYRAIGSSAPRGVKLRHGDVINLCSAEAAELLGLGALEEVESPEGEQAA